MFCQSAHGAPSTCAGLTHVRHFGSRRAPRNRRILTDGPNKSSRVRRVIKPPVDDSLRRDPLLAVSPRPACRATARRALHRLYRVFVGSGDAIQALARRIDPAWQKRLMREFARRDEQSPESAEFVFGMVPFFPHSQTQRYATIAFFSRTYRCCTAIARCPHVSSVEIVRVSNNSKRSGRAWINNSSPALVKPSDRPRQTSRGHARHVAGRWNRACPVSAVVLGHPRPARLP